MPFDPLGRPVYPTMSAEPQDSLAELPQAEPEPADLLEQFNAAAGDDADGLKKATLRKITSRGNSIQQVCSGLIGQTCAVHGAVYVSSSRSLCHASHMSADRVLVRYSAS